MSLLQTVHEEPAKIQFVPQAIVNFPMAYFASKGVRFHQGHDDLDAFNVAEFLLDDKLKFALLSYRNAPADETTLFFPSELSLTEIPAAMHAILDGFDLPMSVVRWMRTRSDTPF